MAHHDIIHVSQPTTGGVGSCLTRLVKYQAELGYRVAVISPSKQSTQLAAREVRHIHWPAERSNGINLGAESKSLRAALRIADIGPSSVVHLHSSKAGLIGRLLLRNHPRVIFQPHGWSFFAANGLEQRAAIAWERFASRWAQRIICVSSGEQREAELRGIHGPFIVVHNGVSIPTCIPTDVDRRAARGRLGLPTGPTVVCIGRLTYAKGQDLLIDLWPSILRRVPDARLYLVGDGELRSQLEQQCETSTIRLVGHSEDVLSWLAAADVVVAPSRWEGMSLTVLEAMSVGRSVVATDVPGMKEMLDGPGGSAGAVIARSRLERFADAVADRLCDRSLAFDEGHRGWLRVREDFSESRWLEGLTAAAVVGTAP